MSEYSIARCVDKESGSPLSRDSAVFVRRINPPLPNVYTIICDPGGRARPFQVRSGSRYGIHTGPVNVAMTFTYLATWVPATELRIQSNISEALDRMSSRSTRYAVQPSQQNLNRREIRATRWQNDSTSPSMLDNALTSFLNAIGEHNLATEVFITDRTGRLNLAERLIRELIILEARVADGQFIVGTNDQVGARHEALLRNPAYSAADQQRRLQMIIEWRRNLESAVR